MLNGYTNNTLPTLEEFTRFMERVEIAPGCWEWWGKFNHGTATGLYARIRIKNRERVYVHRRMYEYFWGPIPEGKVVMHACDNTGCVNPLHLKAGTQGQNIRDSVRKGRHSSLTWKNRGGHGFA